MIKELQLRVHPRTAASVEEIVWHISKNNDIPAQSIQGLRVLKRSIDARQRNVVVNLKVRVYIGSCFCDYTLIAIQYQKVIVITDIVAAVALEPVIETVQKGNLMQLIDLAAKSCAARAKRVVCDLRLWAFIFYAFDYILKIRKITLIGYLLFVQGKYGRVRRTGKVFPYVKMHAVDRSFWVCSYELLKELYNSS